MPDISVVVCAKNEERIIGNCLKLLAKQEIKPEIIVVDGHSIDKTRNIARKFKARVLLDNRLGLSNARNVGWKKAKTEIIAFCDADCCPGKEWTKSILNAFCDPQVVAVSGPLNSYDGSLLMKINIKLWAGWFPLLVAALGYNNVWGANMAFRKSALRKNPFRLKFLEDYDMGQRLRRVGKVRFIGSVKMPISSRRFNDGFFRTCFNFYIKTLIMMKIFRKYDSAGYYEKK